MNTEVLKVVRDNIKMGYVITFAEAMIIQQLIDESMLPAAVPDAMLCDFYEVDNWQDLVRELVGHVEQLQDSMRRNVKPWEDTLPETLLPAYIERIKTADNAAMLQSDGWIPVSERFPEPNTYVLVSNGVWVGQGSYNDSDHLEDEEHWQDEHHEFINLLHHPVTHWQPLPAAPKV